MSKMKKLNVITISLFLIMIMIGVCGCNMNNSNLGTTSEQNVTLNDRQKSILSEQGLSTDYNELTYTQKESIIEIEKMLVYAEKKYNTLFSYAGYVRESSLEKAHMSAYPTNGDKEYDCFTITKTENGYEDDYINLLLEDEFTAYVTEATSEFSSNYKMQIFVDITKTSLTSIPENKVQYDGNVESSIYVFVEGITSEKVDLSELKEHFESFINSHKLYGKAKIVNVERNIVQVLTKYNYTDYLSDEYCITKEIVYLNRQ